MPRYNPKDATEPSIFPKGTYSAVVKRATEEVSQKSGNDMIKLILTVYGPDDTQTDVFDYLVFVPSMLHKVRHFCESAGIDFEKGDLTPDMCVDQNVKVKLKIEKQEGYPEKNAVDDYVGTSGTTRAATARAAAHVAAKPADADVPF